MNTSKPVSVNRRLQTGCKMQTKGTMQTEDRRPEVNSPIASVGVAINRYNVEFDHSASVPHTVILVVQLKMNQGRGKSTISSKVRRPSPSHHVR